MIRSTVRSINTGSVFVSHSTKHFGLPDKFQGFAKVTLKSDVLNIDGDMCWVSYSKDGRTHIFLPRGKFPSGVVIRNTVSCEISVEDK